jgi:hypothetical protein
MEERMDEVMMEIDKQVKAAIAKTAARIEICETLLKKYTSGAAMQKLDAEYQNLKYRSMRLAMVSDILSGMAYVVIEKTTAGNREVFVHKGGDAKMVSMAEKMGLNVEQYTQRKADLS